MTVVHILTLNCVYETDYFETRIFFMNKDQKTDIFLYFYQTNVWCLILEFLVHVVLDVTITKFTTNRRIFSEMNCQSMFKGAPPCEGTLDQDVLIFTIILSKPSYF